MQGENWWFIGGFVAASLIWGFTLAMNVKSENSGYSDKMVISYHCPDKNYERRLFKELVYNTGIQTNFVNTETSMSKHRISIRMTNPIKD